MIFIVAPRTALERNRIKEHGDRWAVVSRSHVENGSKKFLVSVATGHERWWDNDRLTAVADIHP